MVDEFHAELREEEIRRMEWLEEAAPDTEDGFLFFGGITAENLYQEAQQAYLFGLYQTCTITCLCVIEQYLIGVLHSAGDDEIKDEAASAAIEEAADQGLITPDQEAVLDLVRQVRNPTVHFRTGVDEDAFARRAIEQGLSPLELAEEEAQTALKAMFSVIRETGQSPGTEGSQGEE